MKLVGHRTESIYNRYNNTSDDDLREAAHKLDLTEVSSHPAHGAPPASRNTFH